jgi:lipoprotein NlpD
MTIRIWPSNPAARPLWAAPLALAACLCLSPEAPAQTIDVSDIEGAGPHAAHSVASGETLGAIARKYRTPLAEIIRANPGLNPDKLSVGQSLIIPPHEEEPASPDALPEPPATAGIGPTRQYRVVDGDTLSSIAARFNVTTRDIVLTNEALDPDHIAAGQTLSIPVMKNTGAGTVTPIRSMTPEPRAPLVTDFQ